MSLGKKQQLRQELRRVVSNLDERWKRAACVEVGVNLSALLEDGLGFEPKRVLAWVAAFKGEIDLSLFLAKQLRHREVYLPRMSADGQMMFVRIDENWASELEAGPVGVPEPPFATDRVLELESLNDAVILVPGLAFDLHGNRLGRGRGYYDRFLGRQGTEQVTRIGVGWSMQFLQDVPAEPFDATMDFVCHERGYQAVSPENASERLVRK